MTFWRKTVIGILFLTSLCWAQDGTAVDQVLDGSRALSTQQTNGLLLEWSSNGKVAGPNESLRIVNRGYQTVSVKLVPGMIFEDPGDHYQPFILEDGLSVTLGPNEKWEHQGLRTYNLDHSKGPAPRGERMEYKTVLNVDPYSEPIRTLWAGLRLDRNREFHPGVAPILHKTVVLQRALWASIGGSNPDTKEQLQRDLTDDTVSSDLPFNDDKIAWLTEKFWADVMRTLEAGAKE